MNENIRKYMRGMERQQKASMLLPEYELGKDFTVDELKGLMKRIQERKEL